MTGRLISVNVGQPRIVTYRRQQVQTSIWKEPVVGPVPVRGVHVGDDVQADLMVHGGRDKAVYSYAAEDLDTWSDALGQPLDAGTFGENLTIAAMPISQAVVGERWRIGTVVLQVTEPRLPCFKLGIRMGNPQFPRRFGRKALLGAYLRIITEGELQAGDVVEVIDRPAHGVTVAQMGRLRLGERDLAPVVLQATDLPEEWRLYALAHIGRVEA
jgi:MOSC domain-containing protein YiiM